MDLKDLGSYGTEEELEVLKEIVITGLCGGKYNKDLIDCDNDLLVQINNRLVDPGVNWMQLNELLLLLEQSRIGKPFFDYFFQKDIIDFPDLKNGVTRFREYAMLKYANFRYAFKNLRFMQIKDIEKELEPYSFDSETLIKQYRNRPAKAIDIKRIDRDKTWFVGYISKRIAEKEGEFLDKLVSEERTEEYGISTEDQEYLEKKYATLKNDILAVENQALQNTDVYLTWDCMDVYVATSMRNEWEFQETHDFISDVFESEEIRPLNLRCFDPTQSQCKGRLDKGIMEGLMLKRASCTIYLAQESDTMGKDSELASTLAQHKPVIVYIPRYEIDEIIKKISTYPLAYFERRFYSHLADGIPPQEQMIGEMPDFPKEYQKVVNIFLEKYDEYRQSQPFSQWRQKEDKFKEDMDVFQNICRILAVLEYLNYEKRAKILQEIHPLSMQLHLDSGVANGVLVVRNARDCIKLLKRIITNTMTFSIQEHAEGENHILLEEEISECPYRVITMNRKLTSSFWNYYLK